MQQRTGGLYYLAVRWIHNFDLPFVPETFPETVNKPVI